MVQGDLFVVPLMEHPESSQRQTCKLSLNLSDARGIGCTPSGITAMC